MVSGTETARVIDYYERPESIAHCAEARSADVIPARCDVTKIPGISTVRQFVYERMIESTKHIPELIKKDSIHLFNTPHKRQKTNTIVDLYHG